MENMGVGKSAGGTLRTRSVGWGEAVEQLWAESVGGQATGL